MDQDDFEAASEATAARPATAELSPDVWAAQLLAALDTHAVARVERAALEPIAPAHADDDDEAQAGDGVEDASLEHPLVPSEVLEEDEGDDAAWAAALAAAHARSEAPRAPEAPEPQPEPQIEDDDDGDGDGLYAGEQGATVEVPRAALESLIDEARRDWEAEAADAAPAADPEAKTSPGRLRLPRPAEPEAEPAVVVAPELAAAAANDHDDDDELAGLQTVVTRPPTPQPAVARPPTPRPPTPRVEARMPAPRPSPAPTEPVLVDALAPVVEALRSGRAVLCAGPRLGDAPAIRDLLARIVATLSSEEMGEVWPVLQTRALSAAGFIARRLGDAFPSVLRGAARRGDGAGATLARFAALPFRGVITTSGDDAFERALVRDGVPAAVFTPRDGEALAHHGRTPFVVKLLGDFSRPETLVWSAEALQAALADDAWRGALHQLWRTRSFVLVGFAPGDVELEILLERVLVGARGGETEHFALLSASTVEKEELWAGWRVRALGGMDADALAAALGEALAALEPLPAEDDADGWLRLYAADPRRADARAELDRIAGELRERGDHEPLLELLLGRADAEEDPVRRAEALMHVARLFEHELDDAPRALTALLAAYQAAPAQAAWHELERLANAANGWDEVAAELGPIADALPPMTRAPWYVRLGRFADVVRALDEAAAAGGEGTRALRLQAAELTADELGDRAGAIARYEALAADAPGDLDVLRALDRLYEEEGRQVEYLTNLERQAHATDAPTERAALFRKLALLWEEERGGAVHAEQCWQTLLTIEPDADDALRALERAYRQSRRFPALVAALEKRARRSQGPAQADLWVEVASLYEHELEDNDRAIEALLQAEAAAPDHPGALEGLARLYDATGAWHLAVERLRKLGDAAPWPAEAVPRWLRAAELAATRLDDAAEAETLYQRVLDAEPANVPAVTALAALHQRQGAPLRAARLLADAAPQVTGRVERTALLAEAAAIYESLDDAATATELYLLVLEVDPEHRQAAARAAELLWQAQRCSELVPVLEVLTRPGERDDDVPLLVERLVRLGRAARTVGQADKAARAFARAAALDPTSLAAQRAHADELLAASDWAGALQALERIFQHHVERLAPGERAALFCDLSRCELMLGAVEGAREFVSRALEIDPSHRPALELQTELCEANPEALVEAKRALAVTAPPAEQVRLLTEVGDLLAERLGDFDRALGAWAEALELAPEDHRLLHKCLDAHVEARAWPEAIGMLERLIAVEKVERVRAKYRHAAALICRDELGRPDVATAHLRAALDDDPTAERSAQALEHLYVRARDWTELARLWRRRLKTLGAESPGDADGKNGERLRIWSALGGLCLQHLGERQSAIAAFEAALSFDRDDVGRHTQLADLYLQAGPDARDKAIAEHQWVLRHHKSRVESYRALKQLYLATRQRDKATACSYALHFLRKGDADDAVAVAGSRQRPFNTARRVVDEELWARLIHPDEDRLVDLLFALVATTVAAGHAQPRRLAGIDRKNALAADDPRSYAKVLSYVTTTLDVPLPEAYARPDAREAVGFVNVVEGRALVPVFLLGGPVVGDKRREAEQVFDLGRKAALLRPERLLRLVMPHPQQLGHVIDAAMALAAELDGVAPITDALARTVEGMKRALPPPQLEQVAAIGKKMREGGYDGEQAALQWLEASDLTSLRAGYALAGDLETCAHLVATDGRPAGAREPKERLLDLVWSSVTEEIFTVRRHLGLYGSV